jgi:hypothetical protein
LPSKNFILQKLSPFQNYKKVLVSDQSTKDIVNGIVDTLNKYHDEYNKISKYFLGQDVRDTGKNIWEFLKNNVPYYIESGNQQTLRSPSAILSMPIGADCKSFSLFTAGIFESLNFLGHLNVPMAFRFASYKNNSKEPGHVFVVLYPGTNKEIWIDPVLDRFDDRSKIPTYYKDKKIKMSLVQVSGVGYTAEQRMAEMVAYRNKLVSDRDTLLNQGLIKPGGSKELEYKVAINKVTRQIQGMPSINGFLDNLFGGGNDENGDNDYENGDNDNSQNNDNKGGNINLLNTGVQLLNSLLSAQGVAPDFFSNFPFLTRFDNSTFKWKSRMPLLQKMSPDQRVSYYIQKMQEGATFEDAPQQYFELFGRMSGTKSGSSDVGQVSRDVAQLFNDTLNQQYFKGKSVFYVGNSPRNRSDYSINTLISKAPLLQGRGQSSTTQRGGMNIALTLGLVAGAFLLVKQFAKK